MFRFDTSPAKSESSSASNTEDTSSSTQTVNSLHYVVAYCQPPKSSAKDFAEQAQSHRHESPPNQEMIEEEYADGFDTWPKPKERYTRRLIPAVLVPINEISDDFDEDAFNKKTYPNVEIVDMRNVLKGWVLVNGTPFNYFTDDRPLSSCEDQEMLESF